MASVRAVRRSGLMRLVAQSLVLALQITMVPAELFARPARPEGAREQARRAEAARLRAEDPSARPRPQASQPESPARLAPAAGTRSSHAWMVGRLLLGSLRSLLFRLAPEPQGGPPAGPPQTTRSHTFPAGWSLVAVPLHPVDPRATAVFDELPTPLRLYDTVGGQTVSPDEPGFRNVAPGRAFWALLDSPTTVSATGTLASTATPQAVALAVGWNAVSAPWLTSVPWTDARVSVRHGAETVPLTDAVARGWIDGDLGVHDPVTDTFVPVPPNASPAGELVPWRGSVVFAHVAADLVFGVPPPDTTPPLVSFASPAEGAEIASPTDVIGSVDDPNLLEWTLAYSLGSTSPFVPLATDDAPVLNASLGRVDPTLAENGPIVLRLSAIDAAGNVASVQRTVLLSGQAKVGIFQLSFRDLDVPVAGLPITVTRTYDSRRRGAVGDFGFGWSVEVAGLGRYTNNRKPGDGWFFTAQFLPCRSASPTKSHVTEIRLSDREFYRFSLNVTSPSPILGGCFGTAGFTPTGGFPGPATLQILGNTEVFWQNGSDQLVELDTFDVYEPNDVRLILPSGRVYDLNLGRGLTRVGDANGNSLTIGPGGVTHSSGRAVGFTRDGAGRITRITDPLGNALSYVYAPSGDLESFTDRENNTSTFTYDAGHPHLLEAVDDPRGIQPMRNEYDEDGRLVRQTDPFGKQVEFTHDTEARREVVVDRLGQSRVLDYDESGNVVRETDAAGSETLRTFDARGNRLTETNALGQTTTHTYDAQGNMTSLRDALGNVTSATYNARNLPLTATDGRGKTSANTYDANGNLLSAADALGNTTAFTYDARGNPLTIRDAAGNVTRFEYDGFGRVTKQTTALGQVTTYTYDTNGNRLSETTTRTTEAGPRTLVTSFAYDRNGRLTQTTWPDGTITRTVYNSLGKPAEAVDKLGRSTRYTYDELGRLAETAYPDGTTETQAYDAAGRRISAKDRAGRTTAYEYDPVGRPSKTTHPDGSSATQTYDAAGRLTAVKDTRGNTTTYEYDAAGRRTKVTDPLGNATSYVFDANDNLTSTTDARAQVTSQEYDDANRLTKVILADGTFATTAYDAGGRVAAETDPAGRTTQFGYDAGGRLVTVTDALAQVTSFAYDEQRNRTRQTDANGHVTRFEYDDLGRMTRRVLPDGKSETAVYDAAGNLTSRTDFAGRVTTYTHDVNGRVTSRAYPDGSSVSFTYTPMGQRASATDARGLTGYTYDSRDRLKSVAHPDGRRLDYDYDSEGSRTVLRSTVGLAVQTTTFAHDRANRLETVTDPVGRPYRLGHDANGNRTSLVHANGLTTAYAYDPVNRLTSLTTQRGAGVLQSYAYTLGTAGHRAQVQEADGTTVQYTYDELYRLTSETVTGPLAFQKTFGYDAVGNRLTQTTIGSGLPGTPTGSASVSYTYDARDRLLAETSAAYTYDDNGNLVTKLGEASYAWDFEQRLVRVQKTDGTVVEHAYDADGNRVQTRVTPATGPPTITNYLVDAAGSSAHVVAESDGAGNLQATYVRANDDLLAVIRAGTTRFYHADGNGSVRRLSDEAGNVTDTYRYSAFGELVEHVGPDSQPYQFAGEPFEPNAGFAHHRARWYDGRVGRFVSMDPAEAVSDDPAALHRYLYAGADPVNRNDPSGRFFGLADIGAANAIRSILANIQINFGFALMDQVTQGGNAGVMSLIMSALIPVGIVVTGILAIRLFAKAISLARLFRGEIAYFGRAVSTNYRGTFFARFPELEGKVVVHHAVEQQALTKYPGVVSSAEMHSFENLRGIPNAINSDIHLSKIRRRWNEFYRTHPTATKQELLDFATQIDDEFGHLFVPPWR